MTKGAEELFREIELKNIILREQCNNCRLSRHELEKTERELDALLYNTIKYTNAIFAKFVKKSVRRSRKNNN